MGISRRRIVQLGPITAVAGAVGLLNRDRFADGSAGPSPSSVNGGTGPSTAVVDAVSASSAVVTVTYGGETRELPILGFPEGLQPEPGEMVAVGEHRSEVWPLVDQIQIPAGVDVEVAGVTETTNGSFRTPRGVPLPPSGRNRVAFVTRPAPSADVLPRAIAVLGRG